jgi:ElaB/YqjD/DUF883 family membrane-anchored ribosome-binding protein
VDNELEVIRHQMEQKRASLADKLDALEEQVLETVHEATSAVSNTARDVTEVVDSVKENIQETVDAVKENVHETVESIKETFNVRDKISQHPWVALGGGFAAGFAGGMLLGPSPRTRSTSSTSYGRPETFTPQPEPVRTPAATSFRETPSEPRASASRASEHTSEWASQLGSAASEALNTLKGMAVGTLMGVLSEMVGQAVPGTMKQEVNKLFTDLNSRLGGKELYKIDLFDGSSEQAKGSSRNPVG